MNNEHEKVARKTKRSTIMIVDDTPENLSVLTKILRDRDYRVVAFPRGDLAVKAAAKNPPDLILLDIIMPEMDGFAVCKQLKADDVLNGIPVIFISALGDPNAKVAALEAGGVDYVEKPFHASEVLARVETHLALKHQRYQIQEAYDRLRDLEVQRDSLVHMIVHDMRSMLTAIIGNLQLAEMSSLPDDASDCLQEATKATRRLMEMVNSILDISKMEAGRMRLHVSAVDLMSLLSDAIKRVEPIKGKRVLKLEAPDELPYLQGDSHLIERVVQNLIDNALKFTDHETGVVTVGMTTDKDMVRVAVSDNGPGIPPTHQDKVFDKFWQAPAAAQKQRHSTGLGLAFCKLAVEAHGGRIGVESRKGRGCTFWFVLPLAMTDRPDFAEKQDVPTLERPSFFNTPLQRTGKKR